MDIKELKLSNQGLKQNHPWEYARSTIVNKILKKYLDKNIKTDHVLDVGCGDLFYMSRFFDKYPKYKYIAVDSAFDEKLMSELSNHHKDVLLYKDIKDVNVGNKKISVVFLLDVLEHISEDVDFLMELANREYIDENTYFMITVPAFNYLFCEHDVWLGHYRRYSSRQLVNTADKAGFDVVEKGYFFTALLIARFFQKLLHPLIKKKGQEGIGAWTGNRFTSTLYEKILLLDFYFSMFLKKMGINIAGLSTYIICKKK